MNVVLDTNVLVSGLLSANGPPGELLSFLMDGQISAVFSDAILAEYRPVLARPRFDFSGEIIAAVIATIEEGLHVVPHRAFRLPDRADEKFIEAADAAGCPLVTGNLRHFPASARAGVRVLSPREFLDAFKQAAD